MFVHCFSELSTETSAIVYTLSSQSTLVNESLWDIRATSGALLQLDHACETLSKELHRTEWAVSNVIQATKIAWTTLVAFGAVETVDIIFVLV